MPSQRLEDPARGEEEPEVRQAGEALHRALQQEDHDGTTGRASGAGAGGLQEALELGQTGYEAHG